VSKQPKHLTLQLGGLILRRKEVDVQQVRRIPFLHAATRIESLSSTSLWVANFQSLPNKRLWVVPMHLDAFGLHFQNRIIKHGSACHLITNTHLPKTQATFFPENASYKQLRFTNMGRIGSIIHPDRRETIWKIWQHPSLTQDGETKTALKKANGTGRRGHSRLVCIDGFCQNMILQQMKLTHSTPHQVLSQASAPSQIGRGL